MEEKKFIVRFGPKGGRADENCYHCDMSNFTLGSSYTERDILEIGNLSVGETWHDPDYDLRFLPKKVASTLRVKRLK